jgi:phthalate 4,5-dioxygenase reductase subunit
MTPRTLTVASVRRLAEDIFEYRLADPGGAPLGPSAPGAHVHVAVPCGGTRQYSLTGDPAETDCLTIAVKREVGGRGGSTSLIEGTRVGDRIEVSEPANDFALDTGAGPVLLIAGGIGITPILAMAHALHRAGRDFRLIYLTRSPEHTAYGAELAEAPFADRVTLHHDGGDPARAFDIGEALQAHRDATVYCCGPTPLLHAVRDLTRDWPRGAVRFEDFGTDTPPPDAPGERPFRVRLEGAADSYLVPPGRTILSVLQEAGLDMPSSCEAGTCGTCRMRLVSGEADHRDLVLFDDEMEDSIIICCSRARSDEIVIARPE